MARLFMSTLGTSKYKEVYYVLADRKSVYTPFVQEALVYFKCRDWNKHDRIVIFCTPEAETKNWKDREEPGDNSANFDRGLRSRLQNITPEVRVEMVQIPEGKNEDEIMEIFSTVTSKIHPEDDVILDITHSYRSLPLLNTVVINYAKALKNIRITGIYYGAFEVLGTAGEVEKMPAEKRNAPIFDLTPYDRLLDWSLAVNEFVEYGMADRIGKLVGEDVPPVLKEKQGKDRTAKALKALARTLCEYTRNIRGARCFRIEEMTSLKHDIDLLKGQTLIEPLNPLLDLVAHKTRGFDVAAPEEKGFEAARWCIEHELLPQAYVILLETTLTAVCRELGYDEMDKYEREFVSSMMNVVGAKKSESEWKGILTGRKEEVKEIIEREGKKFEDLCKAFSSLGDPRNDFMHCGCRPSSRTYGQLKKGIEKWYARVTSAWRSYASARTSG